MIEVLVVDDDVRVAQNHHELVDSVPGFRVVGIAHTARQAVAQVRRHSPDLVLLDLFLPDASGLDVLKELRGPQAEASGRLVDVLVITALRNVEHLRSALHNGAIYYLLKPFPLSALREGLERYAAAQKKLTRMDSATQNDVDSLLGILRPQTSTRVLPKGLTTATAQLVADALREAGTLLSAAEVSERTGVARVTARRYLEHHCAEGRAELELRYGSAGRPEHRYRWIL
ncbi:response regulator [Hoyosella sp. YIM 151337]|uniref:response regulator n=1 Tax=Hoyosella sp. YIM 151337 TaxID=2992742 RepID=UPI00223640A6|nr:response regulator [Hoyosella sp. YIM 151337]MCW4352096.1 response regulator [Hoyosella sp. YIM 151337]